MEKTNIKRAKYLYIVFSVLMIMLIGRLGYIQILCHDELEEAAISQYEVSIGGMDTRGMILDRNFMPLTGGTEQYYYFIKKTIEVDNIDKLANMIEAKQIAADTSQYYVLRTEYFDAQINEFLKEKYGAYVFKSDTRYANEQTACHLIGYLNEDEKVGVSGLELLFQEQLAAKEDNLSLWADAGGNIIQGEAPKIRTIESDNMQIEANGIVTTVDRRLQYVVEKALEDASKMGAIIVMDADTGEIFAWASSPAFNPNDIQSYLNTGSDCLINKVSQGAYPPGSVFKIVTAAAALENGIDEETVIECKGKITVGGVTLNCATAPEGGHGNINMSTAMATSCNCYFAKLGEMIGCHKIISQAEKMGFGKETMESFPEETCGNLPKLDDIGIWDTSNISIGQGNILATPIQIAQMTSVIARGGTYVKPCIVETVKNEEYHAINTLTAQKIEEMLVGVMEYGTAKKDWKVDVWGKTGTAESGRDGEEKNYCWFTGCCRLEQQRYVITVMVEDGKSGTADALPVFESIVNYLSRANAY